jgi:hypothetical protein
MGDRWDGEPAGLGRRPPVSLSPAGHLPSRTRNAKCGASYKSFASGDGERCSIIEFDSSEHLRAWREHPEHRQAQQLGRERFYAEYSLYVAEPEHEAHFRHEPA